MIFEVVLIVHEWITAVLELWLQYGGDLKIQLMALMALLDDQTKKSWIQLKG